MSLMSGGAAPKPCNKGGNCSLGADGEEGDREFETVDEGDCHRRVGGDADFGERGLESGDLAGEGGIGEVQVGFREDDCGRGRMVVQCSG